MKITPSLFEAFLKCPTKCWLRSHGEPGSGNAFADWVRTQNESYRSEGVRRLLDGIPPDDCAIAPPEPVNLKTAKWVLAADIAARAASPARCSSISLPKKCPVTGSAADAKPEASQPVGRMPAPSPQTGPCILESRLHAVEREPSESRGKPARFIPIRFVFTNRFTRDDKLLLAFDALVLSEMLGHEVSLGKIIHGDDHATLKVKTSALASDALKRTEKIIRLLAGNSPPELVLNRHCAECEFRRRCRQKAMEVDDLSLLSAMTEKERNRHRSKGIFTVNQLSYTFRPRRTPKRAKNPSKPHYHALQALSVRENTVYIHGNPQLPDSKTKVYLDIEGCPDREFYYLIGALVVSDAQETFHGFWADQKSDEPSMLAHFAEAVCQLPDFRVLHFGDYETVALRRVKARLSEAVQPKIDKILERTTNVLSVVHPHIYFPTYSNGLKDIARFLGCKGTHESATGLQTIVWRKCWEANGDSDAKTSLVQYNQDDCRMLKHVCEVIGRLTCPDSANPAVPQGLPTTVRTEEIIKERPRYELFRQREYALEDFKHVSKCAYFDYQREKVLVRTHRQFKIINKRRRKLKRTNSHPNRIINIECDRCPRCRKKSIEQIKQMSRLLIDLKFSRTGVKKWVTKYRSYRYKCRKCCHVFSSEARSQGGQYRYGHALMSWCVYSSFFCGINMSRTRIALGDTFEIFVDDSRMIRSRRSITAGYKMLYSAILQSILQEKILHVDETQVKLRGLNGYVCVITGLDKVYYFYKPSREASFLQEMLDSFSGVLVSDFFTAYDSLTCEQQKCLVHFVRDIDDDLLKNPLDTELKEIAEEFGTLLRTIIQTVDRYGLKGRHLRVHKPTVLRFLDSVVSKDFSSELASNYKRRFQKSGARMFTFLDHDGVPWNNNNAEVAIKHFAKFRRHGDGRFTERSLQEYLLLASVFETCWFNNVNVLKFLLSKETTLEGLLKMAGRKVSHTPPVSVQK